MTSTMTDKLQKIIQTLRNFSKDRNWDEFHTARNLATSVIIEAAELVEHFQWDLEDKTKKLSPEKKQEIADEAADVAIYLIELCDVLDIELYEAIEAKIKKNAIKYPAKK
jgi:NTP pyrophosphatase (non-canonical NTP hydrolase)